MTFIATPGPARPGAPSRAAGTETTRVDPSAHVDEAVAGTGETALGLLPPSAPARPASGGSLPRPTPRGVETTPRGRLLGRRLTAVLFGRMTRFAAVGAIGAVLNLGIMAALLAVGAHYLVAAVVATELTILGNFLLHERLVFHDLRTGRPFWQRILGSLGFNNLETIVRMPVLVLLVDLLLVDSVLAQGITLALAFLARFIFTSRVIYRIRPAAGRPRLVMPRPEEPLP
ncbi:GtrA family protein [Citricoccus sp. SGAir0253]|uniref:GtrA family protein n=1 Tax=Citricoccus sp. SGAir0253 TaxID=2567881 RepID=UPI0010CD0565|nr:GtrA family protein [Citricoccus sp. SGAir0253]QCU77647.1 GtrA family protein [Citricoccus sp. SGAir0253]